MGGQGEAFHASAGSSVFGGGNFEKKLWEQAATRRFVGRLNAENAENTENRWSGSGAPQEKPSSKEGPRRTSTQNSAASTRQSSSGKHESDLDASNTSRPGKRHPDLPAGIEKVLADRISSREVANEILGLARSASPSEDEVKKAYRKKAMQWHPDRQQNHDFTEDATAMFQKVKEAFDY